MFNLLFWLDFIGNLWLGEKKKYWKILGFPNIYVNSCFVSECLPCVPTPLISPDNLPTSPHNSKPTSTHSINTQHSLYFSKSILPSAAANFSSCHLHGHSTADSCSSSSLFSPTEDRLITQISKNSSNSHESIQNFSRNCSSSCSDNCGIDNDSLNSSRLSSSLWSREKSCSRAADSSSWLSKQLNFQSFSRKTQNSLTFDVF